MKNFLETIQKQPYETRVKILWGTVVAVVAVLLIIWGFGLKNTLNKVDKTAFTVPANNNGAKAQEINYITVERVEKNGSIMTIYFNIENNTPDILNFSTNQDITLTADDRSAYPTEVKDRQNNNFVQKVLSYTKQFGVLKFTGITSDTGKLTFNNLSFEQKQSQTLTQTLNLDFKELNQKTKVRN